MKAPLMTTQLAADTEQPGTARTVGSHGKPEYMQEPWKAQAALTAISSDVVAKQTVAGQVTRHSEEHQAIIPSWQTGTKMPMRRLACILRTSNSAVVSK